MTAKRTKSVAAAAKPEKRRAPSPGKSGKAPRVKPVAATADQVRDALDSLIAVETGPWRESEMCAAVAKTLAAMVTGEQVRDALDELLVTGELVFTDAWRRNPSKVAASDLGLAICRALGDAHEPLTVAELHNAVLATDGAPRPSRARVAETVRAMCPTYAAAWPGDRYWTPGAKRAVEPVAAVRAVPSTLPTVADLAATAERKPLRIVTPVTPERLEALERERETKTKEADAAALTLRAATRGARDRTKAIRKGQESTVVQVVTVPDYATNRLVTLVVGDGEPREIKSRKLGAKFRQLTLNLETK